MGREGVFDEWRVDGSLGRDYCIQVNLERKVWGKF
jgi:hypothetical protein